MFSTAKKALKALIPVKDVQTSALIPVKDVQTPALIPVEDVQNPAYALAQDHGTKVPSGMGFISTPGSSTHKIFGHNVVIADCV